MNWAEFQAEHKTWLDANFRNQPPEFPALGMVEEAGELLHVLLKMAQQLIHGTEQRYKDTHWGKELDDAIGDCCIYACSLCTALDLSFSSMFSMRGREPHPLTYDLGVSLVREATEVHYAVTHTSFVEPRIQAFLWRLQQIAEAAHTSFEDAVKIAWAKVQKRKKGVC